MDAMPLHGGDLAWAAAAFPSAPPPWIDLSTGINPWSYPHRDVEWNRLPYPGELEALLSAARSTYRLAPECPLTAVAGVELAIRLLPHLVGRALRVNVVGPTYASHADAWRQAGHAVRPLRSGEATMQDCDICVVVTPNNPDGRVTPEETLVALAEEANRAGATLIVDRSFGDIDEASGALPPARGLLELRSFGKFFGLPGLRLGFAMGDERLVDLLRRILGPWPINSAALAVGSAALSDEVWQRETRQRLKTAAAGLNSVLRQHGTVVGGTDLFRLLAVADAAPLFRHLASRGILTRIFDYEPRWIRFGLPREDAARRRLAASLEEFAEERA